MFSHLESPNYRSCLACLCIKNIFTTPIIRNSGIGTYMRSRWGIPFTCCSCGRFCYFVLTNIELPENLATTAPKYITTMLTSTAVQNMSNAKSWSQESHLRSELWLGVREKAQNGKYTSWELVYIQGTFSTLWLLGVSPLTSTEE